MCVRCFPTQTETKHTQPCFEVSYWLAVKQSQFIFLLHLIELLSDAIQMAVCLWVSKQIPRWLVLCLYNCPLTNLGPSSHQRLGENNGTNKRSREIITARWWSSCSYALNHKYHWCEMGYVGDFGASLMCFSVPTRATCSYSHVCSA